ncbi:MAG: glycosyltransferase [Acidimicrobiales bacterium]
MTAVLLDARLAIRGLGIATYVDRLVDAFSADGRPPPRLWRGTGAWGPAGLASTATRSGLFDVSPRLDPRTRRYDVVHFASNLGPLCPGRNSVVTVYDLMRWRGSRRRDRLPRALFERALAGAGRVVAISDRTRADVEAAVPALAGQVDVIAPGMRLLPAPSGPRRHLLAFGGASDPRKRTALTVDVYRAYRAATAEPLPLVVLARAGLTPDLRRELAALGARVVPSAPAPEVDALMASAAAVLYSTLEEGFGLPILEAAEVGTPVVMDARARVATEVVGRHCFLVDGPTVEDWVATLGRALASGPVDHALDLPGWPAAARRYRELYEEVAGA